VYLNISEVITINSNDIVGFRLAWISARKYIINNVCLYGVLIIYLNTKCMAWE